MARQLEKHVSAVYTCPRARLLALARREGNMWCAAGCKGCCAREDPSSTYYQTRELASHISSLGRPQFSRYQNLRAPKSPQLSLATQSSRLSRSLRERERASSFFLSFALSKRGSESLACTGGSSPGRTGCALLLHPPG